MTIKSLAAKLPFYYGWVIIAIAFITMSISVSARTAFSLFMPPIISEFAWERGLVSGAFSFGFLVSALISPLVGSVLGRYGPRLVIELGVVMLAVGLLLAPYITSAWHLYLTLGFLVGTGANLMSFTAHSLFLPNWFVRRRGLAISIAFSGVGVGAIILLPWLQTLIVKDGWRAACTSLGLIVVCVLAPLNWFVLQRPQDLGLEPDGDAKQDPASAKKPLSNVVDSEWASVKWTLRLAMGTARFWWIVVGYFFGLYAWYAVQVHQTKYLLEIGFDPNVAAVALGVVSAVAIPGQIGFGALSDRIGREPVWTIGCFGFVVCYFILLAMESNPTPVLLYGMVIAQGFLGYAMTSVMASIVAEIFEGPQFAAIFGAITVALMAGGAMGPWFSGVMYDWNGNYRVAFYLGMVAALVSALAIWMAAPRKVRSVRWK